MTVHSFLSPRFIKVWWTYYTMQLTAALKCTEKGGFIASIVQNRNITCLLATEVLIALQASFASLKLATEEQLRSTNKQK